MERLIADLRDDTPEEFFSWACNDQINSIRVTCTNFVARLALAHGRALLDSRGGRPLGS